MNNIAETVMYSQIRRLTMPKFITSLLASLVAACWLSACASNITPRPRLPTDAELEFYNAQVPHEQQIACIEVTPLGSRLARRECHRLGDLEAAAAQGQRVVDLMEIDGLSTNPLGF
jgi:hypothetical protein